jgi:hypothetical protein
LQVLHLLVEAPGNEVQKMAKTKVNKSKIIRDYYLEHPGAGPTEIANAITALGYSVGPAHVNQALKSLKQAGRKKNGRGRPAQPAAAIKKTMDSRQGMSQLKMASEFCQACGGVDAAIELLQDLKSIAAKL